MEKVKILKTCPKCGCGTWDVISAEDGVYACSSCEKLFWRRPFEKEETEPVTVWRDMKTDPPEARETVLALCKDGGQFVGYHTGGENGQWRIWTAKKFTKIVTRTVTHWMPLLKGVEGE